MTKIKEPIRLREKTLKDGTKSLYLDIYHDGVRRYEFLKMYLIPENKRGDKEKNKKTMDIANAIKAKRIIELQAGAYGIEMADRKEVPFFPYYDKMCEKIYSRKNNLWKRVRQIILQTTDEKIRFKSVDLRFVNNVRNAIDGMDIKEGSKNIYFAVFKAVLNQAVRDNIIDKSPALAVAGFKASEAKRTYLTAEELAMLADAECPNDNIKRAFLFACFTGLRLSDVKALKWGDVVEENGYTRLIFRQKKTKWQEYLDINKQAVSLMGERKKSDDNVFKGMLTNYNININLGKWSLNAGVTKHVTFHVARHTFATLMLANGVDLYTVSKLVGHRDIKTTQIYAKIMDKEKRKAVDMLPHILD